jgi:hypothetical protein
VRKAARAPRPGYVITRNSPPSPRQKPRYRPAPYTARVPPTAADSNGRVTSAPSSPAPPASPPAGPAGVPLVRGLFTSFVRGSWSRHGGLRRRKSQRTRRRGSAGRRPQVPPIDWPAVGRASPPSLDGCMSTPPPPSPRLSGPPSGLPRGPSPIWSGPGTTAAGLSAQGRSTRIPRG